jgi:hypothetical protein
MTSTVIRCGHVGSGRDITDAPQRRKQQMATRLSVIRARERRARAKLARLRAEDEAAREHQDDDKDYEPRWDLEAFPD